MRKIVIIFTLMILFSCFGIGVNAINADGDIQGVEWNDSTTMVLFDEQEDSGCNIKQSIVRYKYDSNTRELSLAFICIEGNKMSETPLTEIEFSINGEEKIVLGEKAYFNIELYDIEFGKTDTAKNGFAYEMKIILKKLGYEKIDINAVFTDTNGTPSKEYTISIYDKADEEATSFLPLTIAATERETKKVTTTKAKTTKAKTTKAKTTKMKTEKITTERLRITTSEQVSEITETENNDYKGDTNNTENRKILRYISIGGIIIALAVVVAFSANSKE